MIDIAGVIKRYGSTAALDRFSARIERGEVFGLVGPNGAGKTTLIKVLATLTNPDGGRVTIAGHDVVTDAPRVRALVGYVPDVSGVYQDMRVEEFLDFFADAFHLRGPRRRAAVERALERAGLGPRRADFVEQLSLGLKQRLVLAKSLLHEPEVALLDEPGTGLDPLARIALRDLLKSLARDGVTVVISSHILSDLEDICDRVALIGAGTNVRDAEGQSVLVVRGERETTQSYEIEVLGDAEAAAGAVDRFSGARSLSRQRQLLLVTLAGGPQQAAALLRHLVGGGVLVTRFDPRGPDLEQRFKRAFGGEAT